MTQEQVCKPDDPEFENFLKFCQDTGRDPKFYSSLMAYVVSAK